MMKKLGLALAMAGVTALLSVGVASAQGTSTGGMGTAAQQNRPSTAGVGNPGGRGMRMMRHHRRHHRHHRM